MTNHCAPATPSRTMRLVVGNAAGGAALGVALAAVLLLADFAGLWRLLATSGDALTALVLLGGGFASGFAAVVASTAVMLVPPGKVGARRSPPRP